MTTIERIQIRKLARAGSYSAKGEIVRDGITGLGYEGDLWARIDFDSTVQYRDAKPPRRRYIIRISDSGPVKADEYGRNRLTVELHADRAMANEQAGKVLRLALSKAPLGRMEISEAVREFASLLRQQL